MSVSTASQDATWDMSRGDHFDHDTHAFQLHFPCVSCQHRDKDVALVCQFCRYYCGGKP